MSTRAPRERWFLRSYLRARDGDFDHRVAALPFDDLLQKAYRVRQIELHDWPPVMIELPSSPPPSSPSGPSSTSVESSSPPATGDALPERRSGRPRVGSGGPSADRRDARRPPASRRALPLSGPVTSLCRPPFPSDERAPVSAPLAPSGLSAGLARGFSPPVDSAAAPMTAVVASTVPALAAPAPPLARPSGSSGRSKRAGGVIAQRATG
jgi:hypothetical protein